MFARAVTMHSRNVRVSVLVADDHQSVMEALCALLGERSELEVAGTVSRLEELQKALERKRPQVLVLDVRMGEANAIDLLPKLRSEQPELKIIMLSMYANEAYVFRALQQGADAYLLKHAPSAQLIEAIHSVMRGERYLGEGISLERLAEYEKNAHAFSDDPLDLLTPREREGPSWPPRACRVRRSPTTSALAAAPSRPTARTSCASSGSPRPSSWRAGSSASGSSSVAPR